MTADIPCDGQRRATRELRRLEVVAVTGDCEDLGEVEYRKSNIINYRTGTTGTRMSTGTRMNTTIRTHE